MPWNTPYPVLIWAIIFIPLTVLLWYRRPKDKLTTYLVLLDYALGNLYFFLCVNWAVVNYYLRFLPIVFIVVITIRKIASLRREVWMPKKTSLSLGLLAGSVLLLLLTGFFDFRALLSLRHSSYTDRPALMVFPLRRGLYTVLNGGNGLIGVGMNNYYQDWLGRKTGSGENQVYAYDFGKLTIGGSMSNGILPSRFQDYEVFNDTLYSPCDGTVDYVVSDLPEQKPFTPGTGLGNMIVLKCVDFYVTLSNLRRDGITVKVGDEVRFEEIIGAVGSSAYNSYPSLHMFVTKGSRDGEPVPILFDKRMLVYSVDRWVFRNLLFLR